MTTIGPNASENLQPINMPPGDTKTPLREIPQNSAKMQLKETAKRIVSLSEPLKPLTSGSTNPSDVYFVDEAIFKPGQEEHVKKALTCRSVAKILQLEHAVPATLEAKASDLISHRDLDEDGVPLLYEQAEIDGEQWVIDMGKSFEIASQKGKNVELLDGSTLRIEDDEVVKASKNAPFDEGDEVLIAMAENVPYLVAKEDAHKIDEEGSPHIRRGTTRFELTKSDDATMLVAKNVLGMLQTKVKDVITKINGRDIDIRELSLRKDPNKLLETFFSKIETNSFIESVVLAILFRTQDGKANSLDDTNFLFTEKSGKLHITLIDFDETWPTSNNAVTDPEIVARAGRDVAPIRLGLLAYPQAHTPLTAEAKEHLATLLTTISTKRAKLVQEVKTNLNNEAAVTAFEEVLDRLESAQTTTLKELVFSIFPTYKAQWELLESNKVTQEEIADLLGYAGKQELIQRYRIKT